MSLTPVFASGEQRLPFAPAGQRERNQCLVPVQRSKGRGIWSAYSDTRAREFRGNQIQVSLKVAVPLFGAFRREAPGSVNGKVCFQHPQGG